MDLRSTGLLPALPALLAALRDEAGYVRADAARAIGKIGLAARSAIPQLIAALSNEQEAGHVRVAAAEALGAFGEDSNDAIPALIKQLEESGSDFGQQIQVRNAHPLRELSSVVLRTMAIDSEYGNHRLEIELRSGKTWNDIRSIHPKDLSSAAWLEPYGALKKEDSARWQL